MPVTFSVFVQFVFRTIWIDLSTKINNGVSAEMVLAAVRFLQMCLRTEKHEMMMMMMMICWTWFDLTVCGFGFLQYKLQRDNVFDLFPGRTDVTRINTAKTKLSCSRKAARIDYFHPVAIWLARCCDLQRIEVVKSVSCVNRCISPGVFAYETYTQVNSTQQGPLGSLCLLQSCHCVISWVIVCHHNLH